MRRAIAVGALVGGIVACERVCGELEPLPASATGGVDAGGSALPGTGGMGGLGQATGGAAGAPGGAAGMGSGGIAGSTTPPTGGSGGGSMCLTGTPVNGVLRIFGFQGGALSSDFGRMVSDLEPNPPDPLPADGYNESGMVGPTGAEFSFAFEPCIDATDYVSVGFSHLASVEPPDDMTFSVDFASVTPPPPENFQPGAGQSSCFRLGPGRQNITALRWTYPALMSGYTVNITIDDVAFFDTANCSTGGTGGAAGRGGAAGAGGS